MENQLTKDEFVKQAALAALPAVITNYGTGGNHENKDIIDDVMVLAEMLAKRFVFEEK